MTVQAELAHDEREAAELAGVTWQPEISKMAQTLQRRDADEDSFMRLTRTRTNKTQVTPLDRSVFMYKRKIYIILIFVVRK